MRGPEEWPSSRSNPADRIRLIGPAANNFQFNDSPSEFALRRVLRFRRRERLPDPIPLFGGEQARAHFDQARRHIKYGDAGPWPAVAHAQALLVQVADDT